MSATDYEDVLVETLLPHPKNPRRGNIPAIRKSIETNGWYGALVVQRQTRYVLAGNHRLEAVRQMGWISVPVLWLDCDDKTAEKILLADNRTSDLATYDSDSLAALLVGLRDDDGLLGTGWTDDDYKRLLSREEDEPTGPTLADRFLLPPFSVLDARSGWWRERKQRWLALGIRSELGRPDRVPGGGGGAHTKTAYLRTQEDGSLAPGLGRREKLLYPNVTSRDPAHYAKKRAVERKLGRELTTEEFQREFYVNDQDGGGLAETGTSVFDPVLVELVVRWFSPPGGLVLDPFAGGSVRGIVSGALGRRYVGVDLRAEQIESNEEQAEQLARRLVEPPAWRVGDARDCAAFVPDGEMADLVFTCPPYFDLEVYSDDPDDLSRAETYDAFLDGLRQSIKSAAGALRDDRFAVFVVGEVRDKRGIYRGLVPDVVRLAAAEGLGYYNEAILVTPAGSLPVRAGRFFEATRKLGRTHQTVLVFVKGDPKAATQACGKVDVALEEGQNPLA